MAIELTSYKYRRSIDETHFLKLLFSKCNVLYLLILITQIITFYEINRPESEMWEKSISTSFNLISYSRIVCTCFLLCVFGFSLRRIESGQLMHLILLGSIFAYNLFLSFNDRAAFEAFVRYLFPILFIYYGFFYRECLLDLVCAIFAIVIINDLVQLFVYLQHFAEFDIVKVKLLSSYYIRASGLTGPSSFGFFNFVAAVLSNRFLTGNKRKVGTVVFLVFAFLSFSYKIWVLVFIYTFYLYRKKMVFYLLLGAFAIFCITNFENLANSSIAQQGEIRLEKYTYGGISARAESYRVMFESFLEGNILGKGLGYFGGPASTKYGSPAYLKYDFGWYDTPYLRTTDTYYPHLFVEIGILGGILYLILFFIPLFYNKVAQENLIAYLFILSALFFDAMFSFAIQAHDYLAFSAVILYGLASNNTKRL